MGVMTRRGQRRGSVRSMTWLRQYWLMQHTKSARSAVSANQVPGSSWNGSDPWTVSESVMSKTRAVIEVTVEAGLAKCPLQGILLAPNVTNTMF